MRAIASGESGGAPDVIIAKGKDCNWTTAHLLPPDIVADQLSVRAAGLNEFRLSTVTCNIYFWYIRNIQLVCMSTVNNHYEQTTTNLQTV